MAEQLVGVTGHFIHLPSRLGLDPMIYKCGMRAFMGSMTVHHADVEYIRRLAVLEELGTKASGNPGAVICVCVSEGLYSNWILIKAAC